MGSLTVRSWEAPAAAVISTSPVKSTPPAVLTLYVYLPKKPRNGTRGCPLASCAALAAALAVHQSVLSRRRTVCRVVGRAAGAQHAPPGAAQLACACT